jgi:L-alanine-DL-glutamate epimerase-like enolase superfamily enzyme
MRITRLETAHLRLPLPRQRISLTEAEPARPEAVDVLVVTLHTDSGLRGLGFTASTAAGTALRCLIENELLPLVQGEDPLLSERLWARAQNRLRHPGWTGLAARAYAAIDIALWDLKGIAANLPLYKLLGAARGSAPVYLSDVAAPGQDPAQTLKIARPLIDQGVLGVLVEVGGGDIQLDADRVQQIRDGLGENAWLGIAAEGRYDLGTALAMAHFYEEDVGIDRFEFPLPSDDARGYQRLAERMEVPLALGSSFGDRDDFRRVLEEGNVRVLRPDVLRLGGLTPFLKVAALAEAYRVTVTPYRLPELGVHLVCGLPNLDAVDFTSILGPIFVEPLQIENGKLSPSATPGHGLELSPEAVGRYAAT